ncbi:MAG: hypothetical protein AB1899_12865 [Pseudomonadota bacterium]
MHHTRDVNDYLRRLLVAVLLCPVATGAWILFLQAGFSFDGVMAYMGELSRHYAALGLGEQAAFRFQVYGLWAILAFVFLFLTFALSPPHFSYRLKKDQRGWSTDVVEE